MAKLLIHIGTEKTGTTYLQQWLHRNARTLYRHHRVLYPLHKHLVLGSAHHPLSAALLSESERDFVRETHQRPAEELYAKLVRQIRQTKAKTVLISAEHFSSRLRLPDIHALAGFLHGHEVQILAYVRWQDEMAISHFSTDLRCGRRDWLSPASLDHEHRSLNPWPVAQDWISAFGEDAVQFRCYRQASINGMAADLQTVLGFGPDPRLKSVPARNAAINLTEAQLLHRLNQRLPTWEEALSRGEPSLHQQAVRLRTRVLQQHRLERWGSRATLAAVLQRKQRERFLSDFAQDNQRLAARFELAPPPELPVTDRNQPTALLSDDLIDARLNAYLSILGLDLHRINVHDTPGRGQMRVRAFASRISKRFGLAGAARQAPST